MGGKASVGRRIGGGLIDLIVTFVLVLVIGAVSGLGTTDTQDGSASVHIDGAPAVGLFLVVFLLFAVMEARLGKTPGKMMIGMRVVGADGQPIGFGAALVRNLFRFIDGIAFYIVGLIVIAVDTDNRRLGDMVAKTRVVDDRSG